jgi:hypothetical protein
MRRGFHSLAAQVQLSLQRDRLDGSLYVCTAPFPTHPNKICRDTAQLGSATVVAVRCDSTLHPHCDVVVAIPLSPDGLTKEFGKPDKLKPASQC